MPGLNPIDTAVDFTTPVINNCSIGQMCIDNVNNDYSTNTTNVNEGAQFPLKNFDIEDVLSEDIILTNVRRNILFFIHQ